MALGIQLCAGMVRGAPKAPPGSGIEDHGITESVMPHSPGSHQMRNRMRQWGEEVLLIVAVIAIVMLVMTF